MAGDPGAVAPRSRAGLCFVLPFTAVTPMVLLGFFASALANRLVFAAWALAAGAGMTLAMRRSFEHRWFRPDRRGGLLVTAAAAAVAASPALGIFGWLVGRHGEELDLGGRAVLGGWHLPAAAAPATWYLLAAAALLAAIRFRVGARKLRAAVSPADRLRPDGPGEPPTS